MLSPRVALTIAGFDPSSGAGITADLEVFAGRRIYGTACITALTVQSTRGVISSQACPADLVRDTLEELEADLPPAGIKIGILATREIAEVVASYVTAATRRRSIPVVLDPVLVSSSGHPLLAADAIDALRTQLLPMVTCTTPNRSELSALLGRAVAPDRASLTASARALQEAAGGDVCVIVTGGDLESPDDLVLLPSGEEEWLPGTRIQTTATHGTGCAFSSALLAALLETSDTLEAARAAKRFVADAMRSAPRLGSGRGPLNLRTRQSETP